MTEGQKSSSWRTFLMVVLVLAVLAGGTVLAFGVPESSYPIHSPAQGQDVAPANQAGQAQGTAGNKANPVGAVAGAAVIPPGIGPNTIADIVAQAGPAVIQIETTVKSSRNRSQDPLFNDPFFRQFFGDEFFLPYNRENRGLGSGFIISSDGYILTNEHVVSGADEIRVTISDFDKPLPAEVVGSDFDLDLAILKVKTDRALPFLELGDSDSIRVGNWVIAIGNPYGLDHTVTVGVISAKGRPVTVEDRQYKNLLQTDASINPGNSGGPLLDLEGKIIGINTAINAQAQGIGFAIPTSTVKMVIQDLMEKGKVVRPWLGVGIQPVTPELAGYFGLEKAEGVLVNDVIRGGPAARAGLQRGDVIMEVDGQKVATTEQLVNTIQAREIGQKVVLLVIRGGKSLYITAVIEERQ